MSKLHLLVLTIFTAALVSGCTVRGGWPRFLRHGESPGWSGPKPDKPSKDWQRDLQKAVDEQKGNQPK